ncbi:hypothetical protein PATSB16_34180 [Pandoraea thiooxydans]|nr:hypothetical protein PATSB16_34180 [Pandoraea thiooxydans]
MMHAPASYRLAFGAHLRQMPFYFDFKGLALTSMIGSAAFSVA